MKRIESEDLKYIMDDWLAPYSVAISLKSERFNENDMSFSSNENEDNRRRFFDELKILDKKIMRNNQIHSNRIIKPIESVAMEADGLISDDLNHALMLLTADCYNIFFHTDGKKVFGAVHAGWKGIIGGIIKELKKKLKGESRVLIAQGICAEHFAVKEETALLFERNFAKEFIEREREKKVDLRGILNNELKNSAEIKNLNICNVCDKESLFSFRSGDEKKRNLSIIWRENE